MGALPARMAETITSHQYRTYVDRGSNKEATVGTIREVMGKIGTVANAFLEANRMECLVNSLINMSALIEIADPNQRLMQTKDIRSALKQSEA